VPDEVDFKEDARFRIDWAEGDVGGDAVENSESSLLILACPRFSPRIDPLRSATSEEVSMVGLNGTVAMVVSGTMVASRIPN
jgi:hypothetical protein